MNELDFWYDERADVLTIEGIRYSGGLFRDLAGGIQQNRWFQIVSRDDGVIAIKAASTDAQIVEPESICGHCGQPFSSTNKWCMGHEK